MLTVCENCKTKFSIPEGSVTDGDMVQCSVCGHEWMFTPESDRTSFLSRVKKLGVIKRDSSTVEKSRHFATQRYGHVSRTRCGTKKKIILSLLVILIILPLGLLVMRPEITSRVPGAIGVYQTVDTVLLKTSKVLKEIDLFPSDEERISASIVKATLTNVDNRRILFIRGMVRNISNSDVQGILLYVDLRDDNGSVVKTISFKLKTLLKAQETETFKITVPEPPKIASDIQVRVSNQ